MKKILSLSLAVASLIGGAATASAGFVEVGSASVQTISQDTRWTRDNVYILTRVIYVVPPAKLTIEPGTIIRGVRADGVFKTGPTTEPGTLVITRGAKLIANGTPDDPIIFTALGDPYVPGGAATIPATVNGQDTTSYVTSKSFAPDGATGNNGFSQQKEWGGIILLGQAPIGYDADGDSNILSYDPVTNSYSGDAIAYPTGPSPLPSANDVKGGNGVGVALIEGLTLTPLDLATLSPAGSYTEPFSGAANAPGGTNIIGGVYGGLNRDDNSGVMRFCSSRWGGFVVGTDNEINGITFGGTGRGTVAEWLESFNNADDAFEFFGGYTNFRYLFALYNGDDGFDGDQGFNGTIQFGFNITNNLTAARTGWAQNNTATGRASTEVGDACAEWDGSEDNGTGVTPNTNPYMANMTFVHEKTVTNRSGIFTRRAGSGRWFNSIVQDIGGSGLAAREDNAAGATSVTKDSIIFANCNATTAANSPGTNAIVQAATELVANGHTAFRGLDARLKSTATGAGLSFPIVAKRTDAYPFDAWTPVDFAGAMRDSNRLAGWSVLDYLDVIEPTSVARPEVSMGLSSGNATVSFSAAAGQGGRAVVYAIERSTDRRSWTPVAVVQDNVSNLNDSAISSAGYSMVTSDSNATAGSITVVDTVSGALTSGVPRYYRVIPQ